MSAISELLDTIFEDKRPAFYPEFEGWLRRSRRFREFAHEYRNKIRAKLNNAKHPGSLQDLYAELQASAVLLGNPSFSVEYEQYAATKQRGPDFSVTFKSHTQFNVEVRRITSGPERLATILCEKTGQLPPSVVNMLWLATEDAIGMDAVLAADRELRQTADSKDEGFFQKRGIGSIAEFRKRYQRLSGIVLFQHAGAYIWLNPLARHEAPRSLVSTLGQLKPADK